MTETNTNIVERGWVTVVGWSPMAVINTLWQACEKGVVPQRIVLLASPDNPGIQRNVEKVKTYGRAILAQFGVREPLFEDVAINEDDFPEFNRILRETLSAERQRAQKIIIDTTPGRKYMSALAFRQGQRTDLKVEKLYYNHMLELRYQDVPHPLIPRHEQQLYDLLEVLGMKTR